MSELERVVSQRMAEVEKQVRADYKAAWDQLSAIERQGSDATKRLQELVCQIELEREEKRLESLEKLLSVLADATGELKEVLSELAVKNFQKGQDQAYQAIGESLDRMGYRIYGERWIEETIASVVREQYGERKKGNGKG